MNAPFRQNLFSFDLRSLALFRTGLALLILGDLIHRSFDLRAFYTDFGVLPRWVLAQNSDHCLSLHAMSGSLAFQVILFLIAGGFALMLLVGWRTRLATVASWVFVVSLHDRNFLVLQGGDDLLRLLLFWGMFMPLGARWSVDHALAKPDPPADHLHRSMGTVAFGVQILLLYWCSAAYKIGQPVWWQEGTAMYYSLHLDYLATEIGQWMRGALPMDAMKLLGYVVIFSEIIGSAFLILTPLRNHWRLLAMGVVAGMHVGYSLGLEVGIFPFVAFTALLAFVPTWFWEKTKDWFPPKNENVIKIYYDEECSFCKKTVYILRSLLGLSNTPVMPAQGDVAINALMEEHNSWVVTDGADKHHFKFEAMLVLFRQSRWPGALAWVAGVAAAFIALNGLFTLTGTGLPDFLLGSVLLAALALLFSLLTLALGSRKNSGGRRHAAGTRIYEWVADHREWMGRITARLHWIPAAQYPKVGGQVVAMFFLLYIFFWNLNEINNRVHLTQRLGIPTQSSDKNVFMPESLVWIGRIAHVNQAWNMFDEPPKVDGWLVLPGKLADGSMVDLFFNNAHPPDFQKPKLPSAQYPRFRWRKYMENIVNPQHKAYLLRYGQFMCREWNRTRPPIRHLQTFEIVFVREYTTLTGPTLPEPITLWTHYCEEPMPPIAPAPPRPPLPGQSQTRNPSSRQ
jgi:predicted DCC family thiol-disulfide oxidoreductase YuxK